MKKLKFIVLSFLLLSSTGGSAQQLPKVVGVIATKNQVNRFGPDASDFYGFQSYWRGLNIDASGSQFENLVLKMRVYIDNLDHPGDISFIQDAGFGMIELANEQTPVDTYVQWGIKTLSTPLQHGWTDLYLPLSTGDRKANFDLSKPLNWFRFCFARIPGEPDALQIRLKDIELIDASILVDPPSDVGDDWVTDYLVAEVPFSMNNPLANGVTFSVGQGFTQTPIDASGHDPRQLHLLFDAEVTEQSPGDIFVLSRVSGQIELTSSGRADQNEMLWGIGSVDWKAGQRTYALPFSTAGKTNGDLDLSNINFIRFYAVSVPADYTGRITVKISNVKIVDFTTQTKLPALFGDKMMFQHGKPVKVWGSAVAGKTITVNLYKNGVKIDAKSDVAPESGKWEVSFAAQPASYDRYRLDVLEGETLIQGVDDILFGEVWLSSGQSNMALNVAGAIDGSSLMSAADNDNIRFFLEPTATTASYVPNTDIQGAYWGSGNDGMQVGKVSAVAYSLAVKLQEELQIPVGIINAAVGSSVIEAWLPAADIENDPALMLDLKRLGLYFDEEFYPDGTNQMSSYYNLKINPLLGYGISGLIWYQGESNSGRPQLYAKELDLLKKSYERVFGFTNNDMPFIFSQVCPWVQSLENPQYLAPLAEAMYDGWAMNETGMAMLPLYDTDITYVGNVVIHPTNKTPVGKRFATAALNLVYNKAGEYTAPVFDRFRASGDTLYVKFRHVGDGLKTVNGLADVRGFAICNSDSVYVGAKARIISTDEVAVWNERVKNPQEITYAWASFNVLSNLANSVNIPAAPFRSERITVNQKQYNPQDWSYADGDIWAVSTGAGADERVGFLPAWAAAGSETLSYDETRKSEGKASLRVDYVPGEAGTAGVKPVFTHKTVVPQLANFNTISFDVLNPDDRDKEISLLLKSGTATYKALFVGYEGSETPAASVTVRKTDGFHTLTFLLKHLLTESNEAVANPDPILNNVSDLQFTITDNTAAGTLCLDNVLFGFSTEKQTPTAALPVNKNPIRVLADQGGLRITSSADDLLNKIDVIDLQGKTIYSKAGINSSEHSVRNLFGLKFCILKVQTAQSVSATKIIVR
jgi:sialate O-acetylesterase